MLADDDERQCYDDDTARDLYPKLLDLLLLGFLPQLRPDLWEENIMFNPGFHIIHLR